MECEILVSVMNQKSKDAIVNRLGIKEDDKCIIVNQNTKGIRVTKDDNRSNHKFLSFKEKGLSRSRNRAINNSTGNICIICDDDMTFVPDYQAIIQKAYTKHPEADIICFDFIRADRTRKTMKEGKVGFLRSMKISSAQITFKRESIKKANIRFDENFGTGSGKCDWGEENIFLFDCLRAGLKIYYTPTTIRFIERNTNSTWSRKNSIEHFEKQGWLYYRMSPSWWKIIALQFTLRKHDLYAKDMNGWTVYKSILKGGKTYRKEQQNG